MSDPKRWIGVSQRAERQAQFFRLSGMNREGTKTCD